MERNLRMALWLIVDIVMTKSHVAWRRGHRILRTPAERPSCAISVA